MRAVESALTAYHAMFLGDAAKDRKTWQQYLDDLEKIDEGETPDPKTIRTLQQLKDLDRNPIMHPRETRNAIEAQSLFEIAFTAIVAMVQEMQEKAERLAQEKLPLDEPEQAKVIDGRGKAASSGQETLVHASPAARRVEAGTIAAGTRRKPVY
jgi:hypothetical protein